MVALISKSGNNQYQTKYVEAKTEKPNVRTKKPHEGHVTAQKIAEQHNISRRTVDRCAAFSKAIDRIDKRDPNLAREIMSGEYKIPLDEISNLSKAGDRVPQTHAFAAVRREPEPRKNEGSKPSVKDMPKYDPDREARSLSLTVPSWKESIDRVISVIDMRSVSTGAKEQMRVALQNLITSAQKLIKAISS